MVNLESYDLVIFDFDGTIVKLDIDWNELRKELQISLKKDFAKKLNKELESLNNDELLLALKIIGNYESSCSFKIEKEKIIKIIRQNRTKKIAIFSDNLTSTVDRILNQIGIGKNVHLIIGKDVVKNFKPNEEGLIRILNYFKVKDKGRVLYIGDSEKDKVAAKRVGIKYLNVEEVKDELVS